MLKLSVPVLAVAVTFAGTLSAGAYETYKVVRIKGGDSLVIREEPHDGGKPADRKELGRIPAGATNVLGTGRSKLIGKQRWYEISFGKTNGWVNGTFLEGTDPVDLQGATFQCAGAEPFWGVTLGPQGGEYSDPEAETPRTLALDRVQPATARLFPLLYRMKAPGGPTYRATVSRQEWCSDGMSDYDFGFQVLLTDDEVFQQGCCFLRR